MFKEGMYVRCPADYENERNPRIFICGQVVAFNELANTLTIQIHDPFRHLDLFEDLPKGIIELSASRVNRCTLFQKSLVGFQHRLHEVIGQRKKEDGYFYYYLQAARTKEYIEVCEKDICAAFTNGQVNPDVQLKNYEFQNPCWYLGRSVVSKSMNVLDNSMYGFRELAGSKIYLLPHQVNTIMRCLKDDHCRYMLADEVGMGKTIEALSVLKIFLKDHSDSNVLIIVPDVLKEQWKKEALLKFNINDGENANHNQVRIVTTMELRKSDLVTKWDFCIFDEVHRYLSKKVLYGYLHEISSHADNILLLSATPVQERKAEYLGLLRLLNPSRYDSVSEEEFAILIAKQKHIIQNTTMILDLLMDYKDEIEDAREDYDDPHESDDCRELFDELQEELTELLDEVKDEKLYPLLSKINFMSDDFGTRFIESIISYLCSNYQIESNIIRNRRRLLEKNEDEESLMATRELDVVKYSLDKDKNEYETEIYEMLMKAFTEHQEQFDVENDIKPLLSAFFSSSTAFYNMLRDVLGQTDVFGTQIVSLTQKWRNFEKGIETNISSIISDPEGFPEEESTRMVTVLNYLYEELYDSKVVLFTSYDETFEQYRNALQKLYSEKEFSAFGGGRSVEELELDAYRFENDDSCRIMLCDKTGGEGRNFQCADYIIHIDLPWDANIIEQRIGRLDRLERDPSRNIVKSVVVYAENTVENSLFNLWNDGLKVFTQSLCGLEIIMKDINDKIRDAILENIESGLTDKKEEIIDLTNKMRETVRKEQTYDAAALIYRQMYVELKKTITYYAENDNELFSSSMLNWAGLAGFRGHRTERDEIIYTARSFSPKSAFNSLLIPPKWDFYIHSQRSQFITSVESVYSNRQSSERVIKGTFSRKQAIENDYLHFFAPGDAIFDCITNNALQSCKGQSAAFACKSKINWKGFIFTWSVSANDNILLDAGISLHCLNPYRNFLLSEQIVIPVSVENMDDNTESMILSEYKKMIGRGLRKSSLVHLGKRCSERGFLGEWIGNQVNIERFREEYPGDRWVDLVNNARKQANVLAIKKLQKKSNIIGAKEEMQREISSRIAKNVLYNLTDDSIDKLTQEQKIVLEALTKPKLKLDSVAFIWMVKTDDETDDTNEYGAISEW